MSKINQIQNELSSLDGGTFQKLADAYLHAKGYEQINSIGSVIGANKVRKGTPDSLIVLPNGKYIFAEYTTQKDEVGKKFKEDIEKCLNEQKTGIPISKIEEIVLCHTSTLKPKQVEPLKKECQKHGIKLKIFGIDSIPYDLYQKYPGIARDFLGVEVDTGQILSPDEFVKAYNKRKIAIPLNTTFHFREQELEKVLEGLEAKNLAIISGKAGIGKSRFALEICNRFVRSHPDYEVKCIFFQGRDIFEDIRVYFSKPGKYLIFVDDANRVSGFNYFIDLLHDQGENRQIKVIVTVRDYALEQVLKIAEDFEKNNNLIELELESLEEQQIKKLVKNECNINNQHYLERIADISQGNPRLALMIAEIAKQENNLQSINDVSSVYDEYYSSITKDLEELAEDNLLKTAAIVAFFRFVDYSNEEMMAEIKDAFGMSKDVFREAVRPLHDLEILDLYEDEVVRTSDQVLATYLFYLAFFVEKILKFSTLLENFFPRYKREFVDALNPVLNAFYSEEVIQIMRPQEVDISWESYKKSQDETSLMDFIQVFWFLKETDILIHVRDRISNLGVKTVERESKHNYNLSSDSLLTILGLFINSSQDNFQMALDLLFQYLVKCPEKQEGVRKLITEDFGFKHDSYAYGFEKQRAVIDKLCERVKGENSELFSKLFLDVAQNYLKTHFDSSSAKGIIIKVYDFDLQATEELFQLRKMIWQSVFLLYQVPIFRDVVLNTLQNYTKFGLKVNEIVKKDAQYIIPFIKSELETDNYSHCLIVQEYLDCLQEYQVLFDQNLRNRFIHSIYTLSKVLRFDWLGSQLTYEDCTKLKEQQIRDYLKNYNYSDYEKLFQHCLEIEKTMNIIINNSNCFYFDSLIEQVLIDLAYCDDFLYTKVIKHYLYLGNLFQNNRWLFNFYYSVPKDKITSEDKEYCEQLYELYKKSTINQMPDSLYFLMKYRLIDKNVIVRVIEILVDRSRNENLSSGKILSCIFSQLDINQILNNWFEGNLNLLKQTYFTVLKVSLHSSSIAHEMKIFAIILDLDSNFIFEYIDWLYDSKEVSNVFRNDLDYSCIWNRDDYVEFISRTMEYIYQLEKKKTIFTSNYDLTISCLFKTKKKDDSSLWEKQDCVLENIIKTRHEDIEWMTFIFNIITDFSGERRKKLIGVFLHYNKNLEEFKKIPLEPSFSGWSWSGVTIYQKRIDFFKSLLPLVNKVELLEHKRYIEQSIEDCQRSIEQEKKIYFLGDFI